MSLYKNCGDGFSVKRYVRNTINLSWDKILLTSVISVGLSPGDSYCAHTEM
jgi:hypothetical protein